MGVQTLVGSSSHEGFRFNVVPLIPIALSMFCLSGLAFYHVELGGTGASSGLFQALVVGLYGTMGFVPSFMLSLLVLSWSSIWFITGSLSEPVGRLGRLLLLALSLAVLVNLQPEMGPGASHGGVIGHFLAVRLQSIFGYTLSTLLVAPLALVTLLLATDFFFYKYFETLGQGEATPRARPLSEVGVEEEATETLKSLRFVGVPQADPGSPPPVAVMPEPVDLVVAPETASPAQTGKRRLVLDVDEEIPWEPEGGGAPESPSPDRAEVGSPAGESRARPVEETARPQDEQAALVKQASEEHEEEEEESGAAQAGEYGDEEYEGEEYEEEADEEEADEEEADEEEADEDDEYEEEEYEEDEDEEEEDEDEDEVDLSLAEPDEEPPIHTGKGGEYEEPGEGATSEQLVMFLDQDEPEMDREPIVEIPHPMGEGLVQEAKELVLNSRRVSASYLQRRLRVNFQEAMGLLRVLKGQGVISIGEGETHGKLA